MIHLEGLTREYGNAETRFRALDGIDLHVPSGEFITVVGTSGSGKTTLLNVIGGLDSDFEGQVSVDGKDLSTLRDEALSLFRNQTVGFVFQHFNLLQHLNALQNVAMPAYFAPEALDHPAQRAEEVLVRVGLKDKLRNLPSQLSGGQKQRVAIARALFFQPRLMLCDEPTGNLDTQTGQQIISLFESLNRDDGLTVVVVTHEEFLFKHANRSVHLEDGRVVNSQ